VSTEQNRELWQELILKADLYVDGVDIAPEVFEQFGKDNNFQEEIHSLFEYDLKTHVGIAFPCGFYLPNGLYLQLKWNPDAQYTIRTYNGQPGIFIKNGKHLCDIKFPVRPGYYSKKTSDGQPMGNVGVYLPDGCVVSCYSNECALKEKGEDCLFCNINATKDIYGEAEGIGWKTPRQIGETMAAAYQEGTANYFFITGGLIAERREVEYYLDVAEEIKSHTGLQQCNLLASVGAPHDYHVFEQYKEAGFVGIAMNIEVWDKNIWQTICPGKDKECGGWENWVNGLKQAVDVFGRGKVRSMLVAGIEPKEKTLEGIEYLASAGIIACPVPWSPNLGSALEGHRPPIPAWHLDLAKKTAAIYKKYGYDFATFRNIYPQFGFNLVYDILKIEEDVPFEHSWERSSIAAS
jgi:hypothetical protein